MPEIALHILDLAENSIAAGASRIAVSIVLDKLRDELKLFIEDDGRGMPAELLSRVESPFATTRSERRVGLGIPLVSQLAEMCGGSFRIESGEGKGTRLCAAFKASHVDLPPLGDIPGTMKSLVLACPDGPDIALRLSCGEDEFLLDTSEVREALGGLPLNTPGAVGWIGDCVSGGMKLVFDR